MAVRKPNRKPRGNNLASVARAVAGAAMAAASSSYNNKHQTGSNQVSSNMITTQNDIQRTYTSKRKRLTKKSKRSLKKKRNFQKKVRAAVTAKCQMMTYCGKMTTPVIITASQTWNTNPFQMVVDSDLLSTGRWSRYVLGEQYWNGSGAKLTTGFHNYFNNFIQKYQIRWNTTDVSAAGADTNPGGCMVTHMELNYALQNLMSIPYNVDIYECVAARDMTSNDSFGTPQKAWKELLSDTTGFQSGITGGFTPTVDTYGLTPTDAPNFGKHWKITSKTRVYLTAGQCTSFTVRARPYFHRNDKASQITARKGITKMVMLVIASEIGFDITLLNDVLKIQTSKQYHWKFPAAVTGIPSGIVAAFGDVYA